VTVEEVTRKARGRKLSSLDVQEQMRKDRRRRRKCMFSARKKDTQYLRKEIYIFVEDRT
jgi:hypothetical protein